MFMRYAACFLLFATLGLRAQAEGFEQHAAHQHGKVTVNLAVDGATLTAELDAPAVNVIGFERAPRDAAESARIDAANRWLAAGAGIVGVPPAAGCRLARVEYSAPAFAAVAAGPPTAAAAREHGDYEARFSYTCARPEALAWVELWLVKRLLQVAAIDVNIVTATLQTQRSVGPQQLRIALR
jgi:hypothetical protein